MTEAKHIPSPEFIVEGIFAYSLHEIPWRNGTKTHTNEYAFTLHYDERHGVKREDAEALVKAMVQAPEILECLKKLYFSVYGGNSTSLEDCMNRSMETDEFEQRIVSVIKKATL